MAILNLSSSDQIKVRSSWADVMAMNHFDDQNFIRTLFSNLMDADKQVEILFKNESDLRQQEAHFADILKFIMMYLDKPRILDECIDAFIQENPSVVKLGVSYLEPMGAVIIKTLRQVLGAERFHAGLETLWIKVYIYLANCILSNDVSDVDPVFIAGSDHMKDLEFKKDEETKPLNFKSFSSPMPAFKNNSAAIGDTNTISINLGSNERYRGFRRSVNEPSKSTICVSVPPSLSASPSLVSAVSASSESEPVLTPRSHRRNSTLMLQELGYGSELSLDQGNPSSQSPFDPRRKANHRRVPSDMSLNMEGPERHVSSSSCESPISDVEDHLRLEEEEEMNFDTNIEPRAHVFDSNSFGIKGLAPIAEFENDDESTYSNENTFAGFSTKHSEDETSSQSSSLSLHNSDYKSSISSGTGHSVYDKSPKTHHQAINVVPTPAHTGRLSSPYGFSSYSSSVPSLISRSSGQRASMGFMRSSYILKKEMNELGYIHPENTVSEVRLPSLKKAAPSLYSLPVLHKSEVAVSTVKDYSHEERAATTLRSVNSKRSATSGTNASKVSSSSTSSDKSSFRKKLSEFFGSSSSRTSKKKISHPIGVQKTSSYSRNETFEKQPSSQLPLNNTSSHEAQSISPSLMSSRRVSSMDIRGAPSVNHKLDFAGDNVSMHSSTSGKSNFSLFKGRNKNKEPVNKYCVKKVAYKTVYLKDIIS